MDLTNFIVRDCPPTAIYIPNFITAAEELHIINSVNNAPKPKWTQLSHRRLLNYGGVPHPNGMIAEQIPMWLTKYVDKVNNLGFIDSQKANHVLVNEYLPGSGIMPHLDGPIFYPTIITLSCESHTILDFYSTSQQRKLEMTENIDDETTKNDVMSLSASSTDICDKSLPEFRMFLEPRSLLILKNDLYNNFMHGIADIEEDLITENIKNLGNLSEMHKIGSKMMRNKRISLTIRYVPKTTTMRLKFGPK